MPPAPPGLSPVPVGFSPIDWIIVASYMALVIVIGIMVGRRRTGVDDYFLAGRSMPMWAVAISILATSQSAATFVGGPEQSYTGNLTYFLANLGGLIAVVIVALLFLPAFYRHGVTSIYELLGHRFGGAAQKCAGAMFLIGRVFASGARLFIVALPFSMVAFGDTSYQSLLISIAIIAIGATAYTLTGGIRAVIWTDVLQAGLYITTIVIALWLLWQKFPIGATEIIEALRTDPDGDKLKMLDLKLASTGDLANPYSLWAILFGVTLFNLAAYGTDQDLTQRMLTCKSAARGSWSVIISNLIGWPIVFLFLVMGLLLFVFYQRPDLMAEAAPDYAIGSSAIVFLEFILHEMPTGLRGLMMAGLFAAAMSSMDSALNAMASTTIADFYRPLHGSMVSPRRERRAARLALLFWAITLAGFACFCVYWQKESGDTLIDFALGVMVFAYSGLLAGVITALFTRRGNSVSAIAALAIGFVTVLALNSTELAFAWKMLAATTLSFGVCCVGRR